MDLQIPNNDLIVICAFPRREVLVDVHLDEQEIDQSHPRLPHPPLRLHLRLLHHSLWVGGLTYLHICCLNI